jgi:hypothetical protein
MQHKKFFYEGRQLLINSWREYNDQVIIDTDEGEFKIRIADIEHELKYFKDIEEDDDREIPSRTNGSVPALSKSNNSKKNMEITLPASIKNGDLKLQSLTPDILLKLRDTLLENIDKVKSRPDYIPQAQEVKSNVDSIINLARTEIDMMKTIHVITGR